LYGVAAHGFELLTAVLYFLAPFLVALTAYSYLEKTARSVRIGAESEGDS
jgi:hypothetical protein